MSDFGFYFKIGWQHILTLEALDHILFIAALAAIYLLKDWRQVLILVTAFTIGHTITLVLSTKEWIEVDSSLVEFLIPCTIALTAISNLFQKTFTPRAIRINYGLALFFGLIHGLAFANTLRMILAEDQSFALSMASFSLGLESGQILIVLGILFLSQLCIEVLKIERRHWVIFLSAAVFSLAVEMMIQRWPRHKKESAEAKTFLLIQENTISFRPLFGAGAIALIDLQWRRSVQQRNKIEQTAYRLATHTVSNKNT